MKIKCEESLVASRNSLNSQKKETIPFRLSFLNNVTSCIISIYIPVTESLIVTTLCHTLVAEF
jgi:hypothetical protein